MRVCAPDPSKSDSLDMDSHIENEWGLSNHIPCDGEIDLFSHYMHGGEEEEDMVAVGSEGADLREPNRESAVRWAEGGPKIHDDDDKEQIVRI